jgi:hypothetical protein
VNRPAEGWFRVIACQWVIRFSICYMPNGDISMSVDTDIITVGEPTSRIAGIRHAHDHNTVSVTWADGLREGITEA